MKQKIKKLKAIVKYAIKLVLAIAIGIIMLYGGILYFDIMQAPIEYTAPEKEEPAVINTPKNDVSEAERMLAEATAKLNAEEEKLEKEIAEIKAEAQAQVDEKEAQIAEINKIRSSF